MSKMVKITQEELEDYRKLCKDRFEKRILTPDGLRFICQANHYDPEAIGKQMLENMANICSVRD
ncbi:MAG: cytochrome C [Eubacterium sp.]|nr:cytochrome C [Eubacterium sp.]